MTDKRGFTMMELLAALFLLALFLGSVLYLLQAGTRTMSMNQDDFTAHCACYELIEQVLSRPWKDVPAGVFADADLLNGQPLGSGSRLLRLSPVGTAARRMEITFVDDPRGPVYKKITVTLTYPVIPGSQSLRQFSRTVLYAKETL